MGPLLSVRFLRYPRSFTERDFRGPGPFHFDFWQRFSTQVLTWQGVTWHPRHPAGRARERLALGPRGSFCYVTVISGGPAVWRHLRRGWPLVVPLYRGMGEVRGATGWRSRSFCWCSCWNPPHRGVQIAAVEALPFRVSFRTWLPRLAAGRFVARRSPPAQHSGLTLYGLKRAVRRRCG